MSRSKENCVGCPKTRNSTLVIGMTSLFCSSNEGMEAKVSTIILPLLRSPTVVAFPASRLDSRGRKWRKRNLEACRKSTLSQAGSDRKSNFCSTLPFKIQQKNVFCNVFYLQRYCTIAVSIRKSEWVDLFVLFSWPTYSKLSLLPAFGLAWKYVEVEGMNFTLWKRLCKNGPQG